MRGRNGFQRVPGGPGEDLGLGECRGVGCEEVGVPGGPRVVPEGFWECGKVCGKVES